MKILITGAVGFIGSHTAERLSSLGHEVIGLDNFSPYYSLELKKLNEQALRNKGISVIKKDLRDADFSKDLPKDVDYIFHFAAQPGISKTQLLTENGHFFFRFLDINTSRSITILRDGRPTKIQQT